MKADIRTIICNLQNERNRNFERERERERERVDIKANKWKTHYIIGFDYEIR